MKRFISFLLSIILLLSMSITSFATVRRFIILDTFKYLSNLIFLYTLQKLLFFSLYEGKQRWGNPPPSQAMVNRLQYSRLARCSLHDTPYCAQSFLFAVSSTGRAHKRSPSLFANANRDDNYCFHQLIPNSEFRITHKQDTPIRLAQCVQLI